MDEKKLEEELNKQLELGKMLKESTNQMRTISFVAVYIGIIATIFLINLIFW